MIDNLVLSRDNQQLKQFLKSAYDNIDKGSFVFIDSAKAFDSVYHPRLLLKLEKLGLGHT